MATHAVAHLSGVREHNWGIGLQAHREIEPLKRWLKLTVAKIADSQIAHCGGVVGTDGQRQINQALRNVESSLLKRNDTEQMGGVEIMRRTPENLGVYLGCLIEMSGLMQGRAFFDESKDVVISTGTWIMLIAHQASSI